MSLNNFKKVLGSFPSLSKRRTAWASRWYSGRTLLVAVSIVVFSKGPISAVDGPLQTGSNSVNGESISQLVLSATAWEEEIGNYQLEMILQRNVELGNQFQDFVSITTETTLADTGEFLIGRASGHSSLNAETLNMGDYSRQTVGFGDHVSATEMDLSGKYRPARIRCSREGTPCIEAVRSFSFMHLLYQTVKPIPTKRQRQEVVDFLINTEKFNWVVSEETEGAGESETKFRVARAASFLKVVDTGELRGIAHKIVLGSDGASKNKPVKIWTGQLKPGSRSFASEQDILVYGNKIDIVWTELGEELNRQVVPTRIDKRYGTHSVVAGYSPKYKVFERINFEWKPYVGNIDKSLRESVLKKVKDDLKRVNRKLRR